MSQLKNHLNALFVTFTDTPLVYSHQLQEWRDLHNKHAYNADHEGWPVDKSMKRVEGHFSHKPVHLYRAKLVAMLKAEAIIGSGRMKTEGKVLDAEDESLGTLASEVAFDACENTGIEYGKAETAIYDHLCHIYPEYA